MECTKSVHPREGIRFREAVSECGELIRLNDANRVHLSWSGLPSQRPESRLIRLLDVRPASSTLGDKIALSQHVSDQDRSDEVEGRGPDEELNRMARDMVAGRVSDDTMWRAVEKLSGLAPGDEDQFDASLNLWRTLKDKIPSVRSESASIPTPSSYVNDLDDTTVEYRSINTLESPHCLFNS